eukprot:gnl/MRDRNA2_/MRDRNA2_72438_c0_seq1.p1 gnl/MRDRNA2_/MRDRNA2_72438_c0~~gnl/MRDRNA2_/MRDRNA2_72438_c0_seq1.p1  ORF type:complete len:391 (-),score=35.57 gnl/MRDRNA2_/MRDRNA2_72438_c0_seq1:57-1229(-)
MNWLEFGKSTQDESSKMRPWQADADIKMPSPSYVSSNGNCQTASWRHQARNAQYLPPATMTTGSATSQYYTVKPSFSPRLPPATVRRFSSESSYAASTYLERVISMLSSFQERFKSGNPMSAAERRLAADQILNLTRCMADLQDQIQDITSKGVAYNESGQSAGSAPMPFTMASVNSQPMLPTAQPPMVPSTQAGLSRVPSQPMLPHTQLGMAPNQPMLPQTQPAMVPNQPMLPQTQPGMVSNQPTLQQTQPAMVPGLNVASPLTSPRRGGTSQAMLPSGYGQYPDVAMPPMPAPTATPRPMSHEGTPPMPVPSATMLDMSMRMPPTTATPRVMPTGGLPQAVHQPDINVNRMSRPIATPGTIPQGGVANPRPSLPYGDDQIRPGDTYFS